MSWFELLVYDLKLAIERQKQERYEFPLFLKSIKSIQVRQLDSTDLRCHVKVSKLSTYCDTVNKFTGEYTEVWALWKAERAGNGHQS